MNIQDIQAQLTAALADYRGKAQTHPASVVEAASKKVKALQFELADAIIQGAKRCPKCGALPHGMVQNIDVKGAVYNGFEIGCSSCVRSSTYNPAAFGLSREEAVANWNAGPSKWMAPKERDASGKRV